MVRTSEQPAEGASRALWSSTIAFTVCFAVWTIFSIIGLGVKDQLGLTETEFGLLVGTPILTGSLTRVVLGVWADQFGGRRVFAGVMVAGAIATFLTSYADTYPELLVAALGVGIAGVVMSKKETPSTDHEKKKDPDKDARIEPVIGLGYAGLRGTF